MIAFITGLWAKFQAWIVGAFAIIVAILAIYFKGKSAGKESAEVKQREANDAAMERKNGVIPASPDDTVKRLREGKF